MAAAPLLVRLSPAPAAGEKAILKLQAYFQSGKRSGGGECNVRAGPKPGTYWVDFFKEQGDLINEYEYVKGVPDFSVVASDRTRRRGHKVKHKFHLNEMKKFLTSRVAEQWNRLPRKVVESVSGDIPDRKSVESRTKHKLELGAKSLDIVILPGEGDPGRSRVPAQASASHNSVSASPSLPQQEQRDNGGYGATARKDLTKKIFLTVSATLNTSMFTEDQREKIAIMCPNLKREGNPGMDGSEKLTGDFTDIEKAYHYFEDILEGKDPNHDFSHSECENGLKDENGLNTEEMEELTVVTALYEYFIHTRKEEIKELYKRFGARIRVKGHDDDNTLIYVSSEKSHALSQAASDFFIRIFQETTKDLTQEKIPITNSYTLNETIMKLNKRFRNLLAKEEGNQLLLRGPGSEILAAQKFLAEEGENSQAEKNMKISSEWYKYRNGIEVDASVFKLLETILSKEIESINGQFDTLVEIKENSYGQKVIIFSPKLKTSDMSSHATESFINAFQNAFAMLRQKIISMKLLDDQKKTLNMPVASRKSNVRQKNNLSSEGQTQAKTEENEEDECPICRDRIKNKEILEKCKHAFCKTCIDKAMTYKQACPVCNTVCGMLIGNQPDGKMSTKKISLSLPGYPNCGTIQIDYVMNGGIQTSSHPNPGQRYGPAHRTAYLPDNEEGREILKLLTRAFKQKLIFTVGQSRTTGEQSAITWNDIHHKTAMSGGPTQFGYPDAFYLQRVRSELKAKGIE